MPRLAPDAPHGVEEGFGALLHGSGLQTVRDARGAYSLVPSPSGDQAEAVELKPMVVEGFALGNALGEMEGYNATHSSVVSFGKRNSGGMTPITCRISPDTK